MHAGIAQIGMHHRGDGLAGGHVGGGDAKRAPRARCADAIVERFQREMWDIRSLLT